MSEVKKHYKYACIYTDGGMRTLNDIPGAGAGIHGYFYDELLSMRYAGVPQLITIEGYQPKPTGPQLKDSKYNPTFKAWGETQTFQGDDGKPCKVLKEADVVIVDSWIGFGDQPTNNRGEAIALIELLESCPYTADHYLIKADSQLTINGFNKDMAIWKERGWRISNGSEPKNLDLWLKLDKLKAELLERAEYVLDYIPAHKGHFGNETADRNATHGVCCAVNGHYDLHWISTNLTDGEYWDATKPIPSIMRTKWCYGLTNSERRTWDIDGKTYHHYFVGDHSKNADDAELLGMEISDAHFGLVYHKEPVEILDRIQSFHVDGMWEHNCNMYKTEVINMINISNVNKPKELWRLNNVNLEALIFKSHRNDLVSHDESLLSSMIRPPKLSYRALDIELELHTVLYSALLKLGHTLENPRDLIPFQNMVLTDVTDIMYDTTYTKAGVANGKKLSAAYENIVKSITFKVKHPCSDSEVDLIMSRGIDLPERNNLSAIADKNPKVYIVTWKFSSKSFRYASLVITDDNFSLWEGHYSCRRDVDE